MRRFCVVAALLIGCAGVPEPPAPGTAQAWGHLRLVPREGVTPGDSSGGSYGDRRLRDVSFVDYSRPGFAVVYIEDREPPGGTLELAIRRSRLGTRIGPELGAVGAAGRLVVHNQTPESHLFSYPAAGVVQRIEPGQQVELAVAKAGEQGLFLLDVADSQATVFAAPGPFAVASSSGRFALSNLAPGRHRLRAWHPRFPPALRDVELAPDSSVEVDIELGVGRPEHDHAH
jgi:hypothetical protein